MPFNELPPIEIIDSASENAPVEAEKDWAELAMQIKSAYPGDEGFQVFNKHSKRGSTYDYKACVYKWEKTKPQRSSSDQGIGTLFYNAEQRGWVDPRKGGVPKKKSPDYQVKVKPHSLLEPEVLATNWPLIEQILDKADFKKAEHPYLKSRQISDHAFHRIPLNVLIGIIGYHPKGKKDDKLVGLAPGDIIIVPMGRIDEPNYCTVQFIDVNGLKSNLKGEGTITGAFWKSLELEAKPTIIAESAVTALSIQKALHDKYNYIATSSVNNINKIYGIIKAKFPKQEILLAGELEKKTGGLLDTYKNLASKLQCKVFKPLCIKGTDFNDTMCEFGIDAVKASFRNEYPVLQQTQIETPPDAPNDSLLRSGSDVVTSKIEWLWNHYIPISELTILAGDGGTGKTTLALTLAAIVSNGGTYPDGTSCKPGSVLMISSEDDVSTTLQPRFLKAGGNKNNIYYTKERFNNRVFDIRRDLPILENEMKGIANLSLVILDPVTDAITGDQNSNLDTREGLSKLKNIAREYRCAVIGIAHFNKTSKVENPVDKVLGSKGQTNLARMNIGCFIPKNNDLPRVFARVKTNIAPQRDGFEYNLKVDDDDNLSIEFGDAVYGTPKEIWDSINDDTLDKSEAMFAEQVYRDIQAYIATLQTVPKVIPTRDLLNYLNLGDPWQSYGTNGLTSKSIANLLKIMKVVPTKKRIQGKDIRGYLPESFDD